MLEPGVLKIAIIAIASVVGLIIVSIGLAKGWFRNIYVGKDGVSFARNDEKQFKSGNINKILDDEIVKCDGLLMDFATERADKLRRTLIRYFDSFIQYPAGKRTLSGAIRFPLYHAIRRNNFKIVLRPENITAYVEKIMKEIKEEYDEVDMEQERFVCPLNGSACIDYPKFEKVESTLRERIIEDWVYQIRDEQVRINLKKIEIYEKYLPVFNDLGDSNRIKITEACIQKNEEYARALKKIIM